MIRQVIRVTLLAFILNSLHGEVYTQKSITGGSTPYREVCKNAALDDATFQNFRSIEAYFHAVECGQSGEFADYIRKNATTKTHSLISQFGKLDLFGNPVKNTVPGFGSFSGTTLRYIMVADHISRLFDLPKDYTVVEIGAGFGGQAYILSTLMPFSRYYIYDLPEVELLIEKMTSKLSVQNISCLDAHANLPIDEVDLCISNYALSECDVDTQLDYFKRVVVKAKRGYMLYNDINIYNHLSLSEVIKLLQAHGIQPRIQSEPVFSYTGNVLITWDRTRL